MTVQTVILVLMDVIYEMDVIYVSCAGYIFSITN